MHLIWHNHMGRERVESLIFAPCGTITWGERGWAPHSTNSLSPCDCSPYAYKSISNALATGSL